MLLGLIDLLGDGDIFTLTLVFKRYGEVTFRLPVDSDRVSESVPHERNNQGD